MDGMGKERNLKMYSYVSKKAVKPARKICTAYLNSVKGRLQAVDVQIKSIGSAKMNMVTRNGSKPFDLDFDILVSGSEMEPKKLKNMVLDAARKEADAHGFRKIQDSTSAITCIHRDFRMDLGIIVMHDESLGHRLIHDKAKDVYILNEPVSYKDIEKRKVIIGQHQMTEELRRVYLEKKNYYLKNNDQSHPSFVVYAEAVNQVYQNILSKGGTKMSKGKVSGNTHTATQMNHHANQSNPNNAAYKAAANNHSNQMNPNNSASKGGKK